MEKVICDGAHTVDVVAIDYQAWPMFASPNASRELGTGKVRFEWGGDVVDVDFEVDGDAELIPMRVIG